MQIVRVSYPNIQEKPAEKAEWTSPEIFTAIRHCLYNIKPNTTTWFCPVGDVHCDNPQFSVDKWMEYKAHITKLPRRYFIGTGDYGDDLSASEGQAYTDFKTRVHPETWMRVEKGFRKSEEWCEVEFASLGGEWLGFEEGNHTLPGADGATTGQHLARKFKAPFLGCSCLMRIDLYEGPRGAPGACESFDLYLHHGDGITRTDAASIGQFSRMERCARADVYILSHNHRRHFMYDTILRLETNSRRREGVAVKERRQLLVRTGGFQKGYEPGKVSYAARKMLNPSDLGAIKIGATIVRKRIGSKRVRYLKLEAAYAE